MLYFIIAGVAGFALAASIIALRKVFFELLEASVALSNEVLSKEDERIQQKKLIGALKRILVSLLKTIGAIGLIAIVTLLPLYTYSFISGIGFENLDVSSTWFFVSLSIGSVLPFLFKKKKNEDNYDRTVISPIFFKTFTIL